MSSDVDALPAFVALDSYSVLTGQRRGTSIQLDETYFTGQLGALQNFDIGSAADQRAEILENSRRTYAGIDIELDSLTEENLWGHRVADRAIDRLHLDGSFVDGPRSGPGLLDRPFRPLDGNVEMATALLDLAALTGEDRYRGVARETAAAFAGATERLGVQVAGYGSLVGRLLRGTTVIAVGDEPGSDLHRAAWRVADHEKVVAPNAHLEGSPAPRSVPAGSAVVLAGDAISEPAETPDELMRRVAETAE